MSDSVFANGNAIACKAGDVKVLAAFPDICKSPPGPPTGPIPVPYAVSSFSRDLQKGSKTVKIGGQPIALKNQSYFKSSPLGNEAATKSFGAGIASQQMGGKTYFAMWSMNVRVEGANVCRHRDIATSNHGSNPNTGPKPALSRSSQATAKEGVEGPICECCKGPMHDGQKVDGQPGPVVSEDDWYMAGSEEAAYIYGLLDELADAWPRKENKQMMKRAEEALDRLAQLEHEMVERREMLALGRALGCPSP